MAGRGKRSAPSGRMKFLIDMNLSPPWVSFLAHHGFEATHWVRVGQPSAPDSQIFDFSAANGYTVFPHDLDFGMLLATLRAGRPSVIQVRAQDVLPSAIGDVVVRAIRTASSQIEAGALVTVDTFRHRIRLLPI